MKKAGVVYFTSKGQKVADKVQQALLKDGYQVSIRDREKDKSLSKWTESAFLEYEIVVFVSATGIAVRSIAPFLKSKVSDPAVICIDDNGMFVIPLLSGHLGGANRIAEKLSSSVGGKAVITTATDINGKIAIDSWAKDNNLVIENMTFAKECAMRLLENKPVGLVSQVPVKVLAEGIQWIDNGLIFKLDDRLNYKCKKEFRKEVNFGINISWETENFFSRELKLVPKGLVLGIGCRRGTDKDIIEKVVMDVLRENFICFSAISTVATIDLKKDERGLVDFSREHHLKFVTLTAAELSTAMGEFPKSEFVSKITGVDNVCQRAAVVAAQNGEVLVEKTAREGVTVAVALPKHLKEDVLYVK